MDYFKPFRKDYADMNKPQRQLSRVGYKLEGISDVRYYLSKRKVPILVVDDYYSVAYYVKTRSFQVFTGWTSHSKLQKKFKLKEIKDVVQFLTENCVNVEKETSLIHRKGEIV